MREIVEKSNKMGISTYFFNYASEINNLGGRVNIFLNVNQTKEQIESDFMELVKIAKNIK